MKPDSHTRIAQVACELVASATAKKVRPVSIRQIQGGCINQAFCLNTGDHQFFVKSNEAHHARDMLETEAQGLALLGEGDLKVPRVIAVGELDYGPAVLVLEWIDSASRRPDFSARLGRGLAQTHNRVTADEFGLSFDNFIGLSPQSNETSSNWCDFWKQHRLVPQFERACAAGFFEPSWRRVFERFLSRLDGFLMRPLSKPALLHGDLWSGNYMSDAVGNPVLIDPAVYFGHPEAEFGIISLFGGFDQNFYDAYHEVQPRMDGFSERVEIYKLYHLLNHLNLFGTGYYEACTAILKRFS